MMKNHPFDVGAKVWIQPPFGSGSPTQAVIVAVREHREGPPDLPWFAYLVEGIDIWFPDDMVTKSKPKVQEYIKFPDGTEVACVYTPAKVFAVHKPLDSKKDYVVTHVPTHTVVLRTRLVTDSKSAAKAFEWLFDLLDTALVEEVVIALRSKVDYKP